MKGVFSSCLLISAVLLLTLFSQSSFAQESVQRVTSSSALAFSKGADVGWLSQMEATGYKFYDSDGTQKDCLQLLKDRGINTIRLRVWVNPSNDIINGHCSPAETVAIAVRAQNMGMRIMINFHYSDSWADPSKQTKPAAWASHPFAQLLDDVYNHTFDVLSALKSAGVTPEWVQIGNEIPGGMLWPEGSNSTSFVQLAQLLNKGYDATKAVNAAIKVVVHIDQGNDNARFRWFFDNITANNVKYDVIGMSYYPYWLGTNYSVSIADLGNNLKDMASRYGKEVMVVEVGGDFTLVQNTKDMLVAVISAVERVPNNKGLGVLYWEPQGEKSWSGYQLNAWQSNGKPSPALDAFKENVEKVIANGFVANPVEQGKMVTTNLTYTANSATDYFYVGLFKRNSSGGWLQTITESSGNQFLIPSTGVNVPTQVSLTIPNGTTPSASLTNGEYYEIEVQLWTVGWGTKLSTSVSPKLIVSPTGSLEIEKKNIENGLILYPNPVLNELNIRNTNGTVIQSLKITNITGETVYSATNAEGRNAIDVSNLSSGIYILSVQSNEGTQNFKFQKISN
ncbi:glycosyl hydrolase 53 family protein [Flavobacterium sp.]|jgi:arabinogalactan endo-1,4-beta-galactosidase|uniref:glycosyl hydrolase 53 family protein n=1 Tax=Flavobacterium sp. TaxID=239 RepID=UPI0037C02E2B